MSEAAAQPLNEEYVCSNERWGAGGTWGWGSNKAIETNEMLQNKNINNNQGQTCRCMRTR